MTDAPIKKQTNSNLLSEFKKANNPLYQPKFGISLNQISHWTKDVANNYIIVTIDGQKHLFVGTSAKSILYSIGDKDNSKFMNMTPEEEERLYNQLLGNATPVEQRVEGSPEQ